MEGYKYPLTYRKLVYNKRNIAGNVVELVKPSCGYYNSEGDLRPGVAGTMGTRDDC